MTLRDDSSERERWLDTLSAKARSSVRSRTVAILCSVFLGYLGVDRFYLGYIGLGWLKLVTFGGFGLWWLLDVILLAFNLMKDADGGRLDGRFRH